MARLLLPPRRRCGVGVARSGVFFSCGVAVVGSSTASKAGHGLKSPSSGCCTGVLSKGFPDESSTGSGGVVVPLLEESLSLPLPLP